MKPAKRGRPDRVFRKRFTAAIAIVAALVLAVPFFGAAAARTQSNQESATSFTGIDAGSLFGIGNAGAVLERLEAMADGNAELGAVPDWFDREIGLLPGARDVRVSGAVVGYVVEGESGDALDALCAHMEERGWTCVLLGGVEGATFVKRTGACAWVLGTCTQTGSATSVVLRMGDGDKAENL